MFLDANTPELDPEPHMVECFGRYELVRRLGSGGMAEVHLARVAGLQGFEKLLVLKRILPHLSADQHFVKMFVAEARLAAVLDHPNVVQVYDLGCEAGDYYFVMEFVYGENLQSVLRAATRVGQDLPLAIGVGLVAQAAAGLHFAHERVGFDGRPLGIVHRDVSPTNVMVTYDGCVKVADFGIAKVTHRTDVTRAGTRKGKVPYMSPEQCRAEQLDRRSDIFALGILLYECTTMSRLFDGDNEFGIMNRIVNGDVPPPSSIRTGYPKELERIVMRALATDREARYASARELQLDLERFAREQKLDIGTSAFGEWMHRMFRPQPFPWGALVADDRQSGVAMSTVAESPGMSGSMGGSMGGTPRDFTPSQSVADGYLPSRANRPSVRRDGTLRGVAIGLASVAAVAVLAVGSLWAFAGLGDGSAPEGEPASAKDAGSANNAAAASHAASASDAGSASDAAARASAATTPVDGLPPTPTPGAVAPVAVVPPPNVAQPTDPALVPSADPMVPTDAPALDGDPEPAEAPAASDRPDADDKARSRRNGRNRRGKERRSGDGDKPDLDAFLPQ